jgi:uncharacterized protein with PQ loop repeat
MNGGLHHLHLRKRMTQKAVCEPYPARTPALRFLDRFMIMVALYSPLALLPQVIQVFEAKSATGLSLFTWASLTLVNTLWMVYGFVHKDNPVLISGALIALLDLAIVAGILTYGA